jgi:hypothetical protein
MTKVVIALLACVMLVHTAGAHSKKEEQYPANAGALVVQCRSEQVTDRVFCLGRIHGWVDAMNYAELIAPDSRFRTIIPGPYSLQELSDMFVAYVGLHSNLKGEKAFLVFLLAANQAKITKVIDTETKGQK